MAAAQEICANSLRDININYITTSRESSNELDSTVNCYLKSLLPVASSFRVTRVTEGRVGRYES